MDCINEITLKNAGDVAMEKRGLIKEPEVRKTTLQVVARPRSEDSGAGTLIIVAKIVCGAAAAIIPPIKRNILEVI